MPPRSSNAKSNAKNGNQSKGAKSDFDFYLMRVDGLGVYSMAAVQHSKPPALALMAIALDVGIRSMDFLPAPPQFLAEGALKKFLEEKYDSDGGPQKDNGGAHNGQHREGWMSISPQLAFALLNVGEAGTDAQMQRSLEYLSAIKDMFRKASEGQAQPLDDPLSGSAEAYTRLELLKLFFVYSRVTAQGFVVCMFVCFII
jgi:hypothetical protein